MNKINICRLYLEELRTLNFNTYYNIIEIIQDRSTPQNFYGKIIYNNDYLEIKNAVWGDGNTPNSLFFKQHNILECNIKSSALEHLNSYTPDALKFSVFLRRETTIYPKTIYTDLVKKVGNTGSGMYSNIINYNFNFNSFSNHQLDFKIYNYPLDAAKTFQLHDFYLELNLLENI